MSLGVNQLSFVFYCIPSGRGYVCGWRGEERLEEDAGFGGVG